MNLLADEGMERQIVEQLRRDGHTVLYIAEMEPGIPDDVERALLLSPILMIPLFFAFLSSYKSNHFGLS